MQRRPFGETTAGEPVDVFTLTSRTGIEVSIITYGSAVQQLWVPDREGRRANVVLGFATLDGYLAHDGHYFGAIVGRFAIWIAGGRFTLDGVVHELLQNDHGNSLHGGPRGFDKHVWQVLAADEASLSLRYTSPDGEMGYSGTLVADVVYTLARNALRIDYRAITDAPTVVNLTNHTCWNLAGEGAGPVDEHLLTLNASAYTPVGAGLLPTGEIASVDGTPLDFRAAVAIGSRGYDQNFVLDRPDPGSLALAARVEEPRSGRSLEVHTTEPGLQLYTGTFLDGTMIGTAGHAYGRGECVALETQHFPDSPNQPAFPSTVLRPGAPFTSTTVFRLRP
jgi:aldose 1-epimerase